MKEKNTRMKKMTQKIMIFSGSNDLRRNDKRSNDDSSNK